MISSGESPNVGAACINNDTKNSSKSKILADDSLVKVRSRPSHTPPPKPATNPLQFVKARPCTLYQCAQNHLRRNEDVKQSKVVMREDAEEWQSNLDSWKSSRRKRVEHIIDRVVEAKKIEQEEHNKNRRSCKTFSEMLEKRGTRRKPSLVFYSEEEDTTPISETESNDRTIESPDSELFQESDLDCGPQKLDVGKPPNMNDTSPTYINCMNHQDESFSRGDANNIEYTYEGAINDYKSRVINRENNKKYAENSNPVLKSKESICTEFLRKNLSSHNDIDNKITVKKDVQTDCISSLENINHEHEIGNIVKPAEDMSDVHESLHLQVDASSCNQNEQHEEISLFVSPNDEETYQSLNGDDRDDQPVDVSSCESKTESGELDTLINEVNKISVATLASCFNQDNISENCSDLSNVSEKTADEGVGGTIKVPRIADTIEEFEKKCAELSSKNIQVDYKDTRHIEHDNRNDSKIEEKSNTGPQQDFSVPTTENHLIDLRSPIFCSKDYPIEIVAADSAPLSLLAPIRNIEPPKEKPPRLPEEVPDDPVDKCESPTKWANSTRRIRDELQSKRSSFLGIDDNHLINSMAEVLPPKPPDITSIIKDVSQLDDQIFCNSSYNKNCLEDQLTNDDFGVELDRKELQTTEFVMNQAPTTLGNEELLWTQPNMNTESENAKNDKVLRKTQEIIQRLEQDERSRHNPALENQMFANYPSNKLHHMEERTSKENDLGESTINNYKLQDPSKEILRVQQQLLQLEQEELPHQREYFENYRKWVSGETFNPSRQLVRRHYASAEDISRSHVDSILHKGRAPPLPVKPPLSREMISQNSSYAPNWAPRPRHVDSWMYQKRKSDPPMMNYQHWLVQEAEQRRIDQRQGLRSHDQLGLQQTISPLRNRPNANLGKINRRYEINNIQETLSKSQLQEQRLSVSGKKKCSHCGVELGRGAAMIIESLQLFYHIDCFKCCVCRVQLGDGLIGTDVRVRNHKLHCHNCYSSDEGIKFSCV